MRVSLFLRLLGLAVLGLSACAPRGPAHDKPYFAANPSVRSAALTACQADPGQLAASRDCVNAQAAEADAQARHFYDVTAPASRVTQPDKL